MPNGVQGDTYNSAWCKERHRKLEERMHKFEESTDGRFEKIERNVWSIVILLFGNLAGVITTIALLGFR